MQQSCAQCKQAFDITDEDLVFYGKVSPTFYGKTYPIPPPTQCPDCRFQRRMIWRREHALKNRTCSACAKNIISIHTPDVAYPVYCLTCWWSDNYDPLSYGRPYDPERSFFSQFKELMQVVPQITMMNDNGIGSENCEYCQDFAFSKNCYLVTGAWKLQDCYYCDCNCLDSRHLFDCYSVHSSELVYDSIASQKLYRCAHLTRSENCSDCFFGTDLVGCRNCIACVNLRQKEYCIWNEQYDKKTYEEKVREMKLDSRESYKNFKNAFEQWSERFPRRCVYQVQCEDSTGDDIFHCKEVQFGFQQDACEYCKFVVHGTGSKNSYDVSQTGNPQWCYEGATPDNSYMTHFGTWCWQDKHVLYSDNCHFSEHLFGCIALKRKKYCILNTQYTQEEYERLAGQIIERMISDGEWGEFFPMNMSPYCYNETAAQEYFPLKKEEVLKLGLQWRDDEPSPREADVTMIPDRIADVPQDIAGKALMCACCARPYKILKQELAFYKDMHIPVPITCYECRFLTRVARRNPRKLWKRQCSKCSSAIETTYAPKRPEQVYCEECYLKEVY